MTDRAQLTILLHWLTLAAIPFGVIAFAMTDEWRWLIMSTTAWLVLR